MDKLQMKTQSILQENIEKIRALFPNAVTEVIKDGKVTLAVDFDILKQELSESLIDDKQERYQMTWPDKKKSIVLANSAISAALRPCKEESVDFDNTKNLYIEGDNLDVLKLLRETYLGKVKMIYIDPPYNTGKDFVYKDNFKQNSEEYAENSGQYDNQGNRLVQNPESSGRFHTDWLNMMYPRIRLAKDLLSDDGVVFISIGEDEVYNVIKICDEIFSEQNKITIFNRVTKKSSNSGNNFAPCMDYVVCYAKNIDKLPEYKVEMSKEIVDRYNKTDEYLQERGPYQEVGLFMSALKHGGSNYPIECPDGEQVYPPNNQPWRWNEATFFKGKAEGRIVFKKSNNTPLLSVSTGNQAHWNVYTKVYLKEREVSGMHPKNFSDEFQNTLASNELNKLDIPFDFAKPTALVKFFLKLQTIHNDIILDFFSGSATTAHSVMQLNAEDGGNRKFIMVQLPELCDENVYAGYKNICEIGKERIRRAGKKIKEEGGMLAQNLDIGFRVLKLDSSNMQDVYYNPSAMMQSLLDATIDNVKPDRTPMDLLFQVLLELGVELSAKIEEKEIIGKKYYIVNDNEIIACFDNDLNNEVITEIAKLQPLYAVFKDKSFATDSVGINNEQIFKTYSPTTMVKVI